jgi:hypothetical protein
MKGPGDNPKVNGIILVEGGAANTHKDSYDRFVKEMHRFA